MSLSGHLDPRPRIFHQSHLLHQLACPFVTRRRISCVEQSPPSITPAAKARDDWLLPVWGCERSCFLQRKGAGSNHWDPVLQSAGLHAQPSPARHWENSTVSLAMEKPVEAGRHFLKISGSRTFLGGGCCCCRCFSGCVGTAPGYLCASTAWQPASPFLIFFPLRKHPQKGNERLQPFLSADSRADNEGKFSGIGTYCL